MAETEKGSNIVSFNAYRKAAEGEIVSAANSRGYGGDNGQGGDGGGISELEKRMSAVEGKVDILVEDVSGLKADIAVLKPLIKQVSDMQNSLSKIEGRLVAMPTMWQLIGLIFAIMGSAFAIIRFGLPH